MSTNHFSSDISGTLWWAHQQHHPILIEHPPTSSSSAPLDPSSSCYYPIYPTAHRFNLNRNDEDDDDEDTDNARHLLEDLTTTTEIPNSHEGADEEAKEHMFEKPLTPSDVGKLNRLVIPKQHAEKYFPLGGGDSAESKGLLLSFEDETGKCWRFRYSYWNSSQSYVLTKGWSRYVKEKRLDAGDVVMFERHRGDAQRLFIGWRRRQQSGSTPAQVSRPLIGDGNSNNNSNGMGVGVGWTRGFYPAHPYPAHHQPLPHQPSADCLNAGGRGGTIVERETTAPVENSSRVLRLFGVNMEWQPENPGPPRPESSHLSSRHGTATHQFYRHQPPYSPNPHNHMDVNQMRNRRG